MKKKILKKMTNKKKTRKKRAKTPASSELNFDAASIDDIDETRC